MLRINPTKRHFKIESCIVYMLVLISSHSDEQHFCVMQTQTHWASTVACSSPKSSVHWKGPVSISDTEDGPEVFRQGDVT